MNDTATLERSSIMVVDDTPANLQVLSGMLREQGYRVRPVPSGRLALLSAKAEPPDLVLLDVNMPDMSGYEVSERMQDDSQLRDTPIIFVSAMHETMDKVRAFRAGGVDYVTKPFQFEEIDARVRAHLELRRKRLELEHANARLLHLERLRDGLVHMIVHDMRTPLTGLSGFLEILRFIDGEQLSEQGGNALDLAQASSERLIDMVAAVLDVSKMESGTLKVSKASFDVGEAIDEIVRSYRPEQQCLVRSEIPATPCQVFADAGLLGRCFRSMLANGCQVSSEGGVVTATVAVETDVVRISVEDDGPPIPKDAQAGLFDKFGQVDAKDKRKYVSGLGLALCRLVAEAHGGQVGLECGDPRGRRFWFTLARGATSDSG